MTTNSIQSPLTKKAKGIDTHRPVHFTHPSNGPRNLSLPLFRRRAKTRQGPSSLAKRKASRHVAKAAKKKRNTIFISRDLYTNLVDLHQTPFDGIDARGFHLDHCPFGDILCLRLGRDVHGFLFDLLHSIDGDGFALDNDRPIFLHSDAGLSGGYNNFVASINVQFFADFESVVLAHRSGAIVADTIVVVIADILTQVPANGNCLVGSYSDRARRADRHLLGRTDGDGLVHADAVRAHEGDSHGLVQTHRARAVLGDGNGFVAAY